MSEMVRRVATAICKSRTCEGISCCQWPAQGGRTQCPVKLGYYDDAARAAIEALREPTAAMWSADHPSWSLGRPMWDWWRDMIDAALATSPPPPDRSAT